MLLHTAPIRAQQPLPLRAGCSGCRIDVTSGPSLGDEGDGQLGVPNDVVQDSRGQFIVATRVRPGELLVYSRTGAFVRTIGRKGEGPGEFQFVARLIRAPDGTLHAFDLLMHRWTVLSPEGHFVRSAIFPGGFNHEAAVLGRGQAVIGAFVASPANAGYPLHHLAPDGRLVRSFGADPRQPARFDVPSGWARRIARATDSTVWAGAINEYRVSLWDLNGRKLAELVRDPAPFAPWIEATLPSRDRPPQPLIRAMRQDAEGRLWIMYHIADAKWRAALDEVRTPEGVFPGGDRQALFDTVVEVIDPVRRVVLASRQLDELLDGFAADGLAYGFHESDLKVRVWRLRLLQP